MKKVLLIIVFLLFVVNPVEGWGGGFEDEEIIDFIEHRIYEIRQVAYNSDLTLPRYRAREYAEEIVHQSKNITERLDLDEQIDPLLVTAIIEAETNFVTKDTYDNGSSIGIGSMKRFTAEWIADLLDEEYSYWSVMNATDRGIKYVVYYLGIAYNKYEWRERIVASYNLGFGRASSIPIGYVFYEYVHRVMGRYRQYIKYINEGVY